MSTLQAATSIVLRTSRCSNLQAARQIRVQPHLFSRVFPDVSQPSYSRFSSQTSPSSKIYSFEDVKSFIEKPNTNRILIDSREPGELQATGTIPGSINIPITSKPDSFFITAEEFEDRFGFERPSKEQEVIFYCKSGVRSRAAAALARQAGWDNVAEYQGSWLDWDKKGGVKEGAR
ncbi:hypothetical protein ONS95_000922 [Cadophora gregata]|uniref:uncharacterized protein n=1 Tax=Cadophora gregata TaxID=51156 RepID=UPI0026DC97D4|nr:uncharacterized protein ONS95_000922 [Cadophora gregata]KAK0102882.1 hypothetical protein ONS96_005511 [Cadophora gregata f. sp. sojae]KAK0128979.1 hypothetical protein ONS95_000922 [Cadophora gregata]